MVIQNSLKILSDLSLLEERIGLLEAHIAEYLPPEQQEDMLINLLKNINES